MRLSTTVFYAALLILVCPKSNGSENTEDSSWKPTVYPLREYFTEKKDYSAVYIEVLEKDISKDSKSFSLEKKSYYNNPADCCIASWLAILQKDKKWYLSLSTPNDRRKLDGDPLEEQGGVNFDSWYYPQTAEFWFEMFTGPDFPQIFDCAITNIKCLGKINVVHSKFNIEKNNKKVPDGWVNIVKEFSNQKYRNAPEFFFSFTFPSFTSPLKSEKQKQYLIEFPERYYILVLKDVYGNDGEFPITLMFRGGFPEDQSEYQRIADLEKRINELLRPFDRRQNIHPTEEEYLNGDERKELATLLDESWLDYLDTSQKRNSIYVDDTQDIFIIDGKDIFLAFYTDKHGKVMQNFNTFYRVDDKIIRVNFRRGIDTLLNISFLNSGDIWPAFSKELQKIFDERKKGK